MDRKIALVTGGVGGIGAAICKRLAQQGLFVVANWIIPGTETKYLERMAAAGFGPDATAVAFGDVSRYDSVGEMVAAIAKDHGPVDILVNCAGQRDHRAYSELLEAKRRDREQNYVASASFPALRFAGLIPSLLVQYSRTRSNIDWLYSYARTTASLRLSHAF